MSTYEYINLFSIIGICCSVVGVLLLFLAPKEEHFKKRLGLALFAAGAFAIVFTFLYLNQDFLELIRENLAMTFIGLVITTVSIIKLIKK